MAKGMIVWRVCPTPRLLLVLSLGGTTSFTFCMGFGPVVSDRVCSRAPAIIVVVSQERRRIVLSIRLDQQEINEFLDHGHTLVLTTIDRDGYPHSTPLWYVYMDGLIYTRGRRNGQKVANIKRNEKVSCLVEEGNRWRDLKAVMVRGRAEEVTDPAEQERFQERNSVKYKDFRESQTNMPKATQAHYATPWIIFKITPEKKIATWDNKKISLPGR